MISRSNLLPLLAIVPLLAGCQAAAMPANKAVASSAEDYVVCTTEATIKADKAADRLAAAEASCASKRDAYRGTLVSIGYTNDRADAATSRLVEETRAALKEIGAV